MVIHHKKFGSKEMFYVEAEGKIVGEIVFSKPSSEIIIIEHTEVDESMEGKGIGKDLVFHVVDFARSNNLKVKPYCSFARALFERDKSIADVMV